MSVRRRLLLLRISELIPHNVTEDPRYKEESIKELARSIQTVGLILPIVAIKEDSGYRVIDGNRRLMAYRYLYEEKGIKKYEKIPCVVVNNVSDLAYFINQTAEKWSPITLAKLALEYRKKGYTLKQIAAACGKNAGYISMLLTLLSLPGKIQKAVENGEIAPRTAYELAKLPPDKALEILDEIKGKPRSEALRIIRKRTKEPSIKPPEPKKTEQQTRVCWMCKQTFLKSSTQSITLCNDCVGRISIIVKFLEDTKIDLNKLERYWREFMAWYKGKAVEEVAKRG